MMIMNMTKHMDQLLYYQPYKHNLKEVQTHVISMQTAIKLMFDHDGKFDEDQFVDAVEIFQAQIRKLCRERDTKTIATAREILKDLIRITNTGL